MSVLCPYCGHLQESGEQCAACHGLFEPLSRYATQIAMGPWYSRNEARPFVPGFNLQVLRRQIETGKVSTKTVLRGPTTHQLWARARTVPGVAHLLGICHHCGTELEPFEARTATRCPQCAAPFETFPERNRLWHSTVDPARAVAAQHRLNPDVCPCCGAALQDADRCGTCHTVFAPASAATPVTLGPWFVRNENVPFYAGMAWQEVTEQASAGHIQPATILRGPTTHQFWSVAKKTPGVARLLGFCHACEATVEPSVARCPHCDEVLDFVIPADELGLMFPTDEAAAKAQQELDRAVAEQTGAPPPRPTTAKPPAPAPPTGPSSQPAAQTTAKPRRRRSRTPAGRPEDASTRGARGALPVGEPVETEPADDASADLAATLAAAAPADDAAAAAPIARRRRSRRRQQQQTLMTAGFGVVAVLLLVGVLVVVTKTLGPGPDPEPEAVPPPTLPTGPQIATADQVKAKNDLEARWTYVQDEVEITPRFEPLVTEAKARLAEMRALWQEQKVLEAVAKFAEVSDAIRKIEELDSARRLAARARDQTARAAEEADEVGGPDLAPDVWKQAKAQQADAEQAYEQEQYVEAEQTWTKAKNAYGDAEVRAETAITAKSARRGFERGVTKAFPQEEVESIGGDLWAKASGLIEKGDAHFEARRYQEALDQYDAARALIPEIEEAVRRVVYANFRSLNAGYFVTDLLLELAAGDLLSEARRGELQTRIEGLVLGPDVVAAIPAAGEVPYRETANFLIVELGDKIASVRGGTARSSFEIGVQLRLIERLVERDRELLEAEDRVEIMKSLAIIEKEAEAAEYSKAFFEELTDLTEKLKMKPDFEAVRQSREALADLVSRLGDFESASKFVPRGAA